MIYSRPLLRTIDNFLKLQCASGSSADTTLSCETGPDIGIIGTCSTGSVPQFPALGILINCNSGNAASPGCAVGTGVGTGCGTGNVVT